MALVPSSNACHTVLTLKLRCLTDPNSRVKPEPHPRVHNEKEDGVYMRRGGQPPQWTRRRRLEAHRPVICLGAKNYIAKTHQLRGLRAENGSLSFQRLCVYTRIGFQFASNLRCVSRKFVSKKKNNDRTYSNHFIARLVKK